MKSGEKQKQSRMVPTSFRMSQDCIDILAIARNVLGISSVAFVEEAIREHAKQLPERLRRRAEELQTALAFLDKSSGGNKNA